MPQWNIIKEKDRQAVLEEFIDFALDKNKFPKVRFVSGADVIDWCRGTVSVKKNSMNKSISGIAVSNLNKKGFNLSVPHNSNYMISLYGLNGQRIKVLSNSFMKKGNHTINLAGVHNKAFILSVKGTDTQFSKKIIMQ